MKTPNCISPKIRQSARGEDCALRGPTCSYDPSTTVLAHLRFFNAAGVGQKPHDFHAVYACHSCHAAMDRRSGLIGWDDILRALMETQSKLYAKGLINV